MKDYEEAQQYIDKALELSRKLGMSVTVKGHGAEAHMVNQMRAVKGGLFDLDESWIEQYHQKGYTHDMKLRNQGSEAKKAATFIANDRRENQHGTQEATKRLEVHTRGKREATVQKRAETKKIKTERREASLKRE